MVDVSTLAKGDVILTREGSRARVKQPSEDGEWVLVEYLLSDDGQASGEDLVAEGDIVDVEHPAIGKE